MERKKLRSKSKKPSTHWSDVLPKRLLAYCLRWCTSKELMCVEHVCKGWKLPDSLSNALWEQMSEREYPVDPSYPRPSFTSQNQQQELRWKHEYKERLEVRQNLRTGKVTLIKKKIQVGHNDFEVFVSDCYLGILILQDGVHILRVLDLRSVPIKQLQQDVTLPSSFGGPPYGIAIHGDSLFLLDSKSRQLEVRSVQSLDRIVQTWTVPDLTLERQLIYVSRPYYDIQVSPNGTLLLRLVEGGFPYQTTDAWVYKKTCNGMYDTGRPLHIGLLRYESHCVCLTDTRVFWLQSDGKIPDFTFTIRCQALNRADTVEKIQTLSIPGVTAESSIVYLPYSFNKDILWIHKLSTGVNQCRTISVSIHNPEHILSSVSHDAFEKHVNTDGVRYTCKFEHHSGGRTSGQMNIACMHTGQTLATFDSTIPPRHVFFRLKPTHMAWTIITRRFWIFRHRKTIELVCWSSF